MPVAIEPQIRWLIRRDMPSVLEIENLTSSTPWSEDDFNRTLRQRTVIGLVSEVGDTVAGFCIYEIHRGCIQIRNLAVMPAFQRRGLGRGLIEKLQTKCGGRRSLLVDTEDGDLDSHLFLKACGFRCIAIIEDTVYRFYWTRATE